MWMHAIAPPGHNAALLIAIGCLGPARLARTARATAARIEIQPTRAPLWSYLILAPWGIHSTYSFIVKDRNERALSHFLIFPLLLDDQILFNGAIFYLGSKTSQGQNLPLWRTDGVIMMNLLHSGPVELLYYWLHTALHHHYLYSRYHSHRCSSIVTEPLTCKFTLQFLPNFITEQCFPMIH
ncbi:protein eceriferum 1 [Quercus suber]|uniref:Protein eceriferum 1 n=1 Tax=Quercus suber TaxID=58331 RepID=A0AAW0K1F3_QUESU